MVFLERTTNQNVGLAGDFLLDAMGNSVVIDLTATFFVLLINLALLFRELVAIIAVALCRLPLLSPD